MRPLQTRKGLSPIDPRHHDDPLHLVSDGELDDGSGEKEGSGSYENGRPFKVVAMEKKLQTDIVHHLSLYSLIPLML